MQNRRQFSELNHQHRNKFIILLTISFLPWKQASNSQEACPSSRSYLGLAELKDKWIATQKPDLSWRTGRNKDYQVYSLESRSYFSLHLGIETWNSWVEGLFVIHLFILFEYWMCEYIITYFHNTLKDELKSSPTDTTSVEWFFVLPTSAPFSHLWASYWQQPWGSAGPGHSPAGGKRPLQPDTRPWHYQAAAPGLSGCILSLVHSLLVPSEGDRLMAANGRKRRGPYYTMFHCPTQGITKSRMLSTFTHPTNTFTCPPCVRHYSSHWGCSSEYKFYIPQSTLLSSKCPLCVGLARKFVWIVLQDIMEKLELFGQPNT